MKTNIEMSIDYIRSVLSVSKVPIELLIRTCCNTFDISQEELKKEIAIRLPKYKKLI